MHELQWRQSGDSNISTNNFRLCIIFTEYINIVIIICSLYPTLRNTSKHKKSGDLTKLLKLVLIKGEAGSSGLPVTVSGPSHYATWLWQAQIGGKYIMLQIVKCCSSSDLTFSKKMFHNGK